MGRVEWPQQRSEADQAPIEEGTKAPLEDERKAAACSKAAATCSANRDVFQGFHAISDAESLRLREQQSHFSSTFKTGGEEGTGASLEEKKPAAISKERCSSQGFNATRDAENLLLQKQQAHFCTAVTTSEGEDWHAKIADIEIGVAKVKATNGVSRHAAYATSDESTARIHVLEATLPASGKTKAIHAQECDPQATNALSHHAAEAYAVNDGKGCDNDAFRQPDLQRNRPVVTPSEPGAHATGGTMETPTYFYDSQTNLDADQSSNESAEFGLAVAQQIVEESRRSDLQCAEELDSDLVATREQESQKWREKAGYLFAGAILLIAIAVMLLIFLLPGRDKAAETHGNTTVFQPEDPLAYVKTILDPMLFPSTVAALEELDSPQARAYSWLLEDPNLLQYPQERAVQRFALAAFYFATGGEAWFKNTNWMSYQHHECDWAIPHNDSGYFGEELGHFWGEGTPWNQYISNLSPLPCEGPQQNYAHLWMNNNVQQGLIPPEMYLLSTLRTINIGPANLEGSTIATQIGHLDSLELLNIPNSGLSGTIPTEIGLLSKLRFLSMGQNNLQGHIPSELGLLITDLDGDIELALNQLTGSIPVEVGSMSKLHSLVVFSNLLTGTLPTQIGNLEQLFILGLDFTLLSGCIPSQLGNLSSVGWISMFLSSMTGNIPSQFGQLSSLFVLDVGGCDLTGSVPSELGKLNHLEVLDMTFNGLTGTVPNELELLATNGSLIQLGINGNFLTGEVSDHLCDIGIGANDTCLYLPFYYCSGLQFDCSDNGLCGCDCPCSPEERRPPVF